MRARVPLLALLGGSLAVLVSLYLPWREGALAGPLGGATLDGSSTEAGDVAALLAVALGFASVASVLRPRLAARLPLGTLAAALGYFTAGVALQIRAEGDAHYVPPPSAGASGFPTYVTAHFAWSYGTWVGIAAGALTLIGGVALRRQGPGRLPGRAQALEAALGIAVLAAFLLPWFRSPVVEDLPGLGGAAATVAALVLLLGAGARRAQLPLALAVATLAGAATSANPNAASPLYGAWIGIGCAVALAAVVAVRAWPLSLPAPPRGWAAIRVAAALALLVALFLSWQELRVPHHDLGLNGWEQLPGAAAGGLALLLLALPTFPCVVETVAAIAFLVAWFGGIETQFGSVPVFRTAYGSYVGFAATALLVLTVLAELRPVHVDRRHALVVAVPVAASICCLGAVVVPTWNVLPDLWSFEAEAVSGWFVVAGLLLALYQLRAWTRGGRRTLAAAAFLVLPSLELVRARGAVGMIWGTWILFGLCLFLVVLGLIEEHGGGLESYRVPEEIWRVDRLPGEN